MSAADPGHRVPDRPVPPGDELAHLRIADRVVATYVDGARLPRALAPRPFLHPVTTRSGRLVSDAQPEDHRWHLGVGVAIQDVGGVNVWGGRTYLPDSGYTWLDDHGRQVHVEWESRDAAGFEERLHWLAPDGRRLLSERRCLRAREVGPQAWVLEVGLELRNVTGRPLHLGSPATNGRAGAGYGGFFWRLPPVTRARVFTREADGEDAVHGSVAPWVAVAESADAPFTVALAGDDERTRQDPWFVRLSGYPGLGSQLAATSPVQLEPEGDLRRSFRVLVADASLDAAGVDEALRAVSPTGAGRKEQE